MKFIPSFFSFLFLFTGPAVFAQTGDALLKDSGWSFHFQFTGILQYHPDFHSAYSGTNSFQAKAERAYSVTTTAYIGRKLWNGAVLYFNPEMAGGESLSKTLDIAGFPNGETFRIGDPKRWFMRPVFF